jgi:DtxR family manganese transport transcriptional regulator
MAKKSNNKQPKERSEPHTRTRAHHAEETAEDYVEAVFDVVQEKGECRVLDLARHFAVSHVTVSRIVGRLKQQGLMETAPYRPITLTADGARLAKRVKKRHQVVLEFLLSLGVDQKTAEIDSEGIEHHVSDVTLAAMKRQLKLGKS